jgi:hypothetical protein
MIMTTLPKSSLTDFELDDHGSEAVRAANAERTAVTFTDAPPLSPEVAAIYGGQAESSRFGGLNLKDPRTRKRAEALLALDLDADYGSKHLDALCGQGNSPSSKALRKVFHLLPVVVGRKSGEGNVYRIFPSALSELKDLCGCK